MKYWKKHRNQKGFSLVELVVVMAILSIVGLALYGFFHTSTRSYNDTGAEVDLQYEAQLTQNHLDNLIIDSTKEVKYSYDTDASTGNIILSDNGLDKSAVKKKKFEIHNEISNEKGEKKRDEIYSLEWDTATSKIYLIKTTIDKDGTGDISEPSLLAEYVTDFDVNLERVAKQRVVEFHFIYGHDGKSLEINHNITMRNRVSVNKADSGNEVLLKKKVLAVDIYKDMHDDTLSFQAENLKTGHTTQLKKGESMDLIAKVSGINSPSQKVDWKLFGNPSDSETKITITGDNTCTIYIGAGETKTAFEIQAYSVLDPTIKASTYVSLPNGKIPGGKGFVRGGPGYVMDLESLGVDMSEVASVEWGILDAMIVEGNGRVMWLDRSNIWNSTYFNVPMNQIWKPLEEGQTAADLEIYHTEDNRVDNDMITLDPDTENMGKCLIKAGANCNTLHGIQAFQAVVLAKVTYKDGRVETKQFGQPLKNEDLADPEKRAEVRNNPLFLDCVCVKLVKPDGDEFYDYEKAEDHWKTSGTTHAVLQMKDSDSLQFRIDGYGLYALPEFKCTDESKLTELLENYSFDPATGDVYMKARPGAKGNLTFHITMPEGFQYTVPVEVGAWQTSQ